MQWSQLDISSGFYQNASKSISDQECINCIPVVPEEPSYSNMCAFGIPGIKQQVLTGDAIAGPNRAAMLVGDIQYFANGANLYSMTQSGVVTNRGALSGAGVISQANNGRYLVSVLSNGQGWVYDNTTNQLNQITDADYRPSKTVVFNDGYFLFNSKDGTVFFNSGLNDPFTFDGLDFGTAEINPDKIIALHVNHNELFVCGSETIELFKNVGGTGFPYQRIEGANIQKGVHAAFSIREFDNTFVFAGGGQNELTAIWKVVGSSAATKISTDAIDNAIQEFTEDEIKASFSFDYAQGGRFFVGFTFESIRIPPKTFVYDATASALSQRHIWHQRQSSVNPNRWRVNSITKAFGKLYVGDQEDGRIGVLDLDTYNEYGNVISHEISTAPFFLPVPLFSGEYRLHMESGVGLTSGQGSDPQIWRSYSDNGGRTYVDAVSRSFGKIGDYISIPTWRRQGRIPRSRTLRFVSTDPVKFVIIKLEALSEQGYQ